MPGIREIISLLQDLRTLSREAGGAEMIVFSLDLLIKDLELQEMYGGKVTLRDCPRYSIGPPIAERYYAEPESPGVTAVLPN